MLKYFHALPHSSQVGNDIWVILQLRILRPREHCNLFMSHSEEEARQTSASWMEC